MKGLGILFVFITVLTSSCANPAPCTEYRKRFFNKEVCIIVTDKGPQGNSFNIKGIEPDKITNINYADVDGLYNFIWNSLENGDTIIKKRGNDKFLLKKKDFNLLVAYNCENGVTGAIKPDTLRK